MCWPAVPTKTLSASERAGDGNYVVAAASVARGSTLTPASVTLKRGRLDQLPPRAVLDMSGARCSEPARSGAGPTDTAFDVARAWRIKAGQRVLVIANGDGFRVNAEGKALNNAAVAQNARVRMISGRGERRRRF